MSAVYVLFSRLNKTECLTHHYPRALLKSLWEEIFQRNAIYLVEVQLTNGVCKHIIIPFAFYFWLLKTRCSKSYNSIALSITELLLLLHQLSNCRCHILNRDPHFMHTIMPSLSPVTGKASECFVRAKGSKIQ